MTFTVKWKNIIASNHCGYNPPANYAELVEEHPLTDGDMRYFEAVINSGMLCGQSEYDMFPENGGIDIAAALLAEVRRLRRPPTDRQVDAALDVVLRAAGSQLRYYTLPKVVDDMRAAMRSVLEGRK